MMLGRLIRILSAAFAAMASSSSPSAGESLEDVAAGAAQYVGRHICIEGFAACPECYQIDNGGCSGALCVGDLVLQKEESGGPAVIIHGSFNGLPVGCASDGCILKANPLDLGVDYRVWGRIKETLSKDPAKAFALAIDSFNVVKDDSGKTNAAQEKDRVTIGTGVQRTVYLLKNDTSGIWVSLKNGAARKDIEDASDTVERGTFHGLLVRGVRDGPWKEYYANGVVRSSGIFSRGAKTGVWREYDSLGGLLSEGPFLHGRETGVWKVRAPGKRSFAKVDFGNEDKVVFTTFSSDSFIDAIAIANRFTESVERLETYFPGNRKKRLVEIDPHSGAARIGEWLPDGGRIYFFSAANGVIIDSIWYKSGKLWKTKTRDMSGKRRAFAEFYPSGTPRLKGWHNGLRPDGIWTQFDYSGVATRKISYVNGIATDPQPATRGSPTHRYRIEPIAGSTRINSIMTAKDGIWVGTESGALRYSFKGIFDKKLTTADGLPGNRVSAIACDSVGDLWFGFEHNSIEACPTGGACCITIMGVPLAKLSADRGVLGNPSDDTIAAGGRTDRALVAGIAHGKLSYYDSLSGDSYIPPVASIVATAVGKRWYSSLSGIRLIGLPSSPALGYRLSRYSGPCAVGPDGALWVAYGDSLYKIVNDSVLAFGAGAQGKEIMAIRPGAGSKVFFLTSDALFCFNGRSTAKTASFAHLPVVSRLPLSLESDGSFVFATDSGLVRLSGGKPSILVSAQSLGGQKITGFTGHSSSYWIGTTGGLYQLEKGAISRVALPQGPAAAFLSMCVAGPAENIYVYSPSQGVYRRKGDDWKRIDLPPISADIVQTLCAGPDSQFFAGTDRGLIYFDGRAAIDCAKKNRLASGSITSSVRASNGNILYVLDGYKIIRTNGRSFSLEGERIPSIDGAVTALLSAADGALWIADRNGISVVYGDSLVKAFTAADGLPLFPITEIFESKSGVKYARSIESVYRFDGKHWSSIGTEDDINGARITGITEDKNGTLWIGTRNGLCRFEENGSRVLSITEGLLDKGVNAIAADNSGDVWAATDAGVSKVTVRPTKPF